MEITAFAALINAVMKSINGLIEHNQVSQEIRGNVSAMYRLLYFECKRNLDLIDSVTFDQDKKIRSKDSDFIEVISLLETMVLNSIFQAGKLNVKFFNELHADDYLTVEENIDEKRVTTENFYTVVGALAYLQVKVSVLQKMAGMKCAGNAHREIRFRIRLERVKKAYLWVVGQLEQQPEIKKIIRKK